MLFLKVIPKVIVHQAFDRESHPIDFLALQPLLDFFDELVFVFGDMFDDTTPNWNLKTGNSAGRIYFQTADIDIDSTNTNFQNVEFYLYP